MVEPVPASADVDVAGVRGRRRRLCAARTVRTYPESGNHAEGAVRLSAVAGGDLGAMRVLYGRHAPWLSARLMRRCNSPEVVADVLQDTIVAVWKGADRGRGDGVTGRWAHIRRLCSRLRGRRQDLVLPVEDLVGNASSELRRPSPS
jgi:hypothetical protein